MSLSIKEQLKKFRIDEATIKTIRKAGEAILPMLPEIIEKYRQWLLASPEMVQILGGTTGVEKNAKLKEAHWGSVWLAEIDEAYLDFRRELGKLHAELGISLENYFSIVTTFLGFFDEAIEKAGISTYELSNSFLKLVNLDVSIVLEAYSKAHNEAIKAQNEVLMSMSTPVAQLWDSILLLPLVGVVDSKRAQETMNTMLQRIANSQAKVFILDISGVAVVDTAVANHFMKIAKATRLMGCKTIISGISPAIAQTIVELGVVVDEIITTSSMQDALKEAFKLTKVTLAAAA